MRRSLAILSMVFLMVMRDAQAQPLTIDPESIVPLPAKFDMEPPTPDVPPEMARFYGAWIGTWHDDRHILVVERIKPNGHADVVFAQSDSAFFGTNREWWRSGVGGAAPKGSMAKKTSGALTTAASPMSRQALRRPSMIWNRRLPTAAHCPACSRGRYCSPASHAAVFSPCIMPVSGPAE